METFFGVISRILDQDLYHIEVDVPGEDIKLRAFPKRGEVDEPRVGDVVLITEFDPLYHSFSLYEKLKENEFIGIRARGKKIWMNEEFIQVGIYPLDSNNDGDLGGQDETSMVTAGEWYDTKDGSWNGDDAFPGVDTKCTSWFTVDKYGNLDVFMEKTGHIHITEDHKVRIDGNLKVEIGGNAEIKVGGNTTVESSGSCTIDSPDVKITGASLTINGTAPASGSGPLNCLPTCIFSGCVHNGNKSLSN